ncbi:MAG: TIGR00341 family protein [Candidatus Heimdallarchaeota archaeon]|nr:TIGR00341 family protein [Candidatus Heimdallarchaeota archaeon]
MKQIQVIVPASDGNEIVKSLIEVVSPSQIEHIKGEETSLILITTLPYRTGFILEHLSELGIGRVKGRISISEIEATIPKARPRKQDKFLRRISIEELEQNVSTISRLNFNFIAWTILSSILAAMGLIGDDNVTLIASMIIAPLMGPIVGITFGAITSNQRILKEGLLAEGTGIGISILIGFIIGLIYRFTLDEPSAFIVARGEPNIINLIIAIASGLTAGICFVSGTSLALVGVAAAAALLPVTVNVGIAVGMFQWRIALGSLILFITNVACVLLGCMIVFLIRKVEPPQAVKRVKAKRSMKTQIIAWVLILIAVAVPITQTSVHIVQKWRFEKISLEQSTSILTAMDPDSSVENLEVQITGGVFNYQVRVSLRVFATQVLPNSTYLDIKTAIEGMAGHSIELDLVILLGQKFNSSMNSNLLDTLTSIKFPIYQRKSKRIFV